MIKVYPLIICLFVFAGYSGYATDAGWNLAIDRDGIKIYTRPTPGCPLDEFKGVTEINASITTIEKLLRDVNSQPEWMADCFYARVLKEFDKDHLVCYNVLNLPWPFSDRDILIDTRVVKEREGKKFVFEMSVFTEDIIPVDSKYVRIRDFVALCSVEQIRPDVCTVVYVNRVNPMAPVPNGIANSIARNNPFNTLKGMKRMVQLARYRNN